MKTTIQLFAITLILVLSSTNKINSCTRVVYVGLNDLVLTGRTMDWREDIKSNLWIFPRGIERSGETGTNSLKWTSKYGSLVVSAYEMSSTDGMNERGLVANLLWLAESEYAVWDQKKPGLSIAAWVQYVLDNFATVEESVNELRKETFEIVSDKIPGSSQFANLHLSISDASGDNAIFEYIKGKLVIHHNKQYQVMTNSPIYSKQLAINEYWEKIGGMVMLPGTNRASDRFVRASYYINIIPKTEDKDLAAASVLSVIRNVSVPFGISTPNQPNISSTLWRVVADQKNMIYYFDSTFTPNVFWIDFKDLDFTEKAPIKKLSIINHEVYAGNASVDLVESEPFKFQGL